MEKAKAKEDLGWSVSERKDYAERMFVAHPDLFPEKNRTSILDGIITVGMTPFEAKLAGGAFYYQVIPDKAVWPENYDPFTVMWEQSCRPDNSFIKMTFQNSTQYSKDGVVPFEVTFKKGTVFSIHKIK